VIRIYHPIINLHDIASNSTHTPRLQEHQRTRGFPQRGVKAQGDAKQQCCLGMVGFSGGFSGGE